MTLCASPQQDGLTDDGITVLRYAADALTKGIAAAVVTLMEIRSGAARGLGSQMAVLADGRYIGLVSGGASKLQLPLRQSMRSPPDGTEPFGTGKARPTSISYCPAAAASG